MDHLRPIETKTVSQSTLASPSVAERDHSQSKIGVSAANAQPQVLVNSARGLDQFYTREKVAIHCYRVVRKYLGSRRAQFVEPSAGTGSFFRLLPPGSIGYDIDPQSPDIIKADFLQTEIPWAGDIVIIGNPPFGKNSSMAVKFFNHAARQAEVIAFILPRTFQKTSIINRLDRNFHLVHEELVQENAFIFEGKPKHVPTVFQIWVRKNEKREKLVLPVGHPDFEFTTPDRADFAIKRVGVGAGRLHHDFTLSPNSHYFFKANVDGVEATMGCLDFEALTKRTAGSPSLSKTELVALYTKRKTLQSHPALINFRRLMRRLRCGCLHLKDMVKFGPFKQSGFTVTGSYVFVDSTEPDATGIARRKLPLTPKHTAGLVGMWEEHGKGRIGIEANYTGVPSLEDNPYRTRSRPHLHLGILGEITIGRISLFANAENLLDVRQTNYDPLLRPQRAASGELTVGAWAPLRTSSRMEGSACGLDDTDVSIRSS